MSMDVKADFDTEWLQMNITGWQMLTHCRWSFFGNPCISGVPTAGWSW